MNRTDRFLGVEIGASKLQVALGGADGRILSARKAKVVLAEGAQGILRWMETAVPELQREAAMHAGAVRAIGVGFGGILETATGRSVASVQVDGWKDFPLKAWFEDTFSLPAAVVNDTVAGGYAEYRLGAGIGSTKFFYSNIGSGIGGVFIDDGRCADGSGYGASYLGHTYVPDLFAADRSVAFCKVEQACSGFGIERRLRTSGYVPDDSLLLALCGGARETLTCVHLGEAAFRGDRFAREEIDRIARSYAIGLANLITLLGPDRVAIGGGVAKLGELLLAPIRHHADALAFVSTKDRYEIVAGRLEDDAVLAGAILFAAEQEGVRCVR
jgi:glucokinase